MTTISDLPGEGQHIAPKDFDDCRRRHGRENPRKSKICPPTSTYAISTTSTSLLDGHAFAERRFDLVQHTHELVDVMYACSDG
jgi:hypothetical protein